MSAVNVITSIACKWNLQCINAIHLQDFYARIASLQYECFMTQRDVGAYVKTTQKFK